MRGLLGMRWGLWLAVLATSVLTSCVQTSSDTTKPSVPTGLTASAVSCSQINLSWNASTDTGGSGLKGYNVYGWRNSTWSFLKQVLVPAKSTSNTGLSASTLYYFAVAAVDTAGNTSALSTLTSAATTACTATTTTSTSTTTLVSTDKTAPAMPTGVTAAPASCSQINLSWLASTDTGGSGLRGYNVYRNGVYLKQVLVPATSSSDTPVAASTVYSYAVKSVDNAGNASAMSATTSTNTPGCPVSGGAWVKGFGGTGFDETLSTAVDASGNVVVAGFFQGTVSFGGSALTSAGGTDIFLAKYSATGAFQWAKRFGGAGDDVAYGVAVDGNGNVVVAGKFQGTVDFGAGPVASQGGTDIFLAKYSSSGAFQWAKPMGSANDDVAFAVAVDSSNNVLMTGDFWGTMNFGGGPITPATSGSANTFVAKYTSAGTYVWAKNFTTNSTDAGYGIAADLSGNVLVTGHFLGIVECGCGFMAPSGPGYGLFLAQLSGSTGACTWSKAAVTTSSGINSNAVISDRHGGVIITGTFGGTTDFGGGPVSAGTGTMFLVKYNTAGLAGYVNMAAGHAWEKLFGNSMSDAAGYGVAVDGSGNAVMTGTYLGNVDFGGGGLMSAGGYDIVVGKYAAANGGYLWAKRFGSTGVSESGRGLAVDGSGNVIAGGTFQGSNVNFGVGTLTSAGGNDAFVVKIGP